MQKSENFICGKYAVVSAIENIHRKKHHLFYLKQHLDLVTSLKNKINFKTSLVDLSKLNFLAKGLKHQGLILKCDKFIKGGLENYLEKVASIKKNNTNERIIILDHPLDSRNVGSVIRSMYLTGFTSIFIPKKSSCSQDASMALAASGALDIIDYYQVPNIIQVMKKLKENDFWLFGLSQNGRSLYDMQENISKSTKIALIIGKESLGLSSLVEKNCDFLVSLAMGVNKSSLNSSFEYKKNIYSTYLPDSYNLSIAASIAMYTICQYNLKGKEV